MKSFAWGFTIALARLFLGCSAIFQMSGCNSADPPPPDTNLKLQLHDSLGRYDHLEITLLDPMDTGRTLEWVYLGPLPKDARIPDYTLKAEWAKDFVVKVAGFTSDNQRLLETLIYYRDGRKTIVYNPVPGYQPRFRLLDLSVSAGTLSPAFSGDVTEYRVQVPEGVATLSAVAIAAFSGASITFAGDPLPSGTRSKPIALGTRPDTIPILVTDASQMTSFTRAYRLILSPTLPAPLQLASLVPSVGTLVPPFQPGITTYTLALPFQEEKVTFVMHPMSPGSMTLVFSGWSIFPGQVSEPIRLQPGGSELAYVEVRRGTDMTFYQITITRP